MPSNFGILVPSPIVNYILISRWNEDDEGLSSPVVEIQYPKRFLRTSEARAASKFMMPSSVKSGFTTFFLNRKQEEDDKKRTFEANIYDYTGDDSGWTLAAPERKVIALLPGKVEISSRDGTLLHSIVRSTKTEYIHLHPKFIGLPGASGALGLLFESEQGEAAFVHHMNNLIDEANEEIDLPTPDKRPLICASKYGKKNGVAVCSSFNQVHLFKPLLEIALKAIEDDPSEKTAKELFDCLNSLSFIGAPQLTAVQKINLRVPQGRYPLERGTQYAKKEHKISATFRSQSIETKLCTTLFPDELTDGEHLKSLIQKFGPDLKYIYNAVLTNKRVLFLVNGGVTVEEGTNAVFGTLGMFCPPIGGLSARLYPITGDLKALRRNFIASITSTVGEVEEGWDVLADLNSGKVTLGPTSKDLLNKCAALDGDFFAKLQFYASGSAFDSAALIRDRTQWFLDLCYQTELDPQLKEEATKNEPRISPFLKEFPTRISLADTSLGAGFLLQVSKFYRKAIPEGELVKTLESIQKEVVTVGKLEELFSHFGSPKLLIETIGSCLFNSNDVVKKACVNLFVHLHSLDATLFDSINRFLHITLVRLGTQYKLDVPPLKS